MNLKKNLIIKRINKTKCFKIIYYFNNFILKIISITIFSNFSFIKTRKKKKIGVIGVSHRNNIGNNLLKYAMFIKLSELGFDTYIIGTHKLNDDISFINQSIKIRIIKNNFSEIKERDYDILMVNSDQTWTKMDKHFYDIAFLRFAKKWRKKKFIYGASLGYDYWTFTQEDEKMAKGNLKRFTGISVREKGSISKIEKHLNFKPILVLDPTLLINKKYYLNLITNYKGKRIVNKYKYIFTYIFLKENKKSSLFDSVFIFIPFHILKFILR